MFLTGPIVYAHELTDSVDQDKLYFQLKVVQNNKIDV